MTNLWNSSFHQQPELMPVLSARIILHSKARGNVQRRLYPNEITPAQVSPLEFEGVYLEP